MVSSSLRAVVIGAGWAGEGHTRALQFCGVDVVGICARDKPIVADVAQRLGIPHAYDDWRRALDELRPDIVALATPAELRTEPIEVAAARGVHVYCDKPLSTTAGEARRIYETVKDAGIKHAYAATLCYDPAVTYLRELIAEGSVGQLRGVDMVYWMPWFNPLATWTRYDSLALGGGTLNGAHTHALAILERFTRGKVVAAVGHARVARTRAPYAGPQHDSRALPNLSAEQAAQMEWRGCDSDRSYTALHMFALPDGTRVPVFTAFHTDAPQVGPVHGWFIYGDKGTLVAKDEGVIKLAVYRQEGNELVPMPTPQRLVDAVPQLSDHVMSRWAALARDFVADICGEPHEPYLTFEDGCRYQVMIDAIRSGAGWSELPTRV